MIKIIRTDDGSHSLFIDELNESYHSFHGAVRESEHVFIENGLNYFCQKLERRDSVKIYEVGFGTGLNALLAAKWADVKKIRIEYSTLECFPLPKEIINQLNYSTLFSSFLQVFESIHNVPWGSPHQITDHFTICKTKGKLEDISISKEAYDIIFYDAFAPSKQPEMWEADNLSKTVKGLKKPGVFVTYCAKGQLKRDLRSLDCQVESLPGPPGKKEMVRAIKL